MNTNFTNGLIVMATNETSNHLESVGFDLDFTIIKPLGKRKFSKTPKDWEFMSPKVTTIMRELVKTKNVVIFSNQLGLKNNVKKQEFIEKIKLVQSDLDIPFILYASILDDSFRKPRTGMFTKYKTDNPSIKFLYYIGDAAGRENDFSASDIKFAFNLNVLFYTPEVFFKDIFNPQNDRKIQADLAKICNPKDVLITEDNTPIKSDYSVIVFTGFPGSGKSTFYGKHFKDSHVHINQDKLKTNEKCIKEIKESLSKSRKVVVDKTNPDINSRKIYIDIAKQFNVSVCSYNFITEKDTCLHNNYFRSETTNIKPVPKIAYNIYESKFTSPETSEGFEEVMDVPFHVDLGTKELQDSYQKYFI